MKINHLIIAATASLLLASCNKDDGGETNVSHFPKDKVLRVTTDVNEALLTRAEEYVSAGFTTANLKDFYLNFTTDGAPEYTYTDINVEKDEETNVWNLDDVYLWKDETTTVYYEAVKFGGCSFYDIASNVLAVPLGQESEEDLQDADLLYMPLVEVENPGTNTTYIDSKSKLKISLAHQLTKFDIYLDLNNEFLKAGWNDEGMISDFEISGTETKFKFNTGALPSVDVKDDEDDYAIMPYQSNFTPAKEATETTAASNATARYEAIIVPQTVADKTLKITFWVGPTKYEWVMEEEKEFKSGCRYELRLKVGKEVVEIENNGFTSSKWDNTTPASDVNTD